MTSLSVVRHILREFLTQKKNKFYKRLEKVAHFCCYNESGLFQKGMFPFEGECLFTQTISAVTSADISLRFPSFVVTRGEPRPRSSKKRKISRTRHAVQSIGRNRKWFCRPRLLFQTVKAEERVLKKRRKVRRVIKLENTRARSKSSLFGHVTHVRKCFFVYGNLAE